MNVTTEFRENLTTSEIVDVASKLSTPDVVLWYIGQYGLKEAGTEFYKKHLIDPIFQHANQPMLWLLDLTAWNALNNPNASITKASTHTKTINSFSDHIKCIKSSDIFKTMRDLSDQQIVYHFNNALPKDFSQKLSENFPDREIKIGTIFNKKCPIISKFYDLDASKGYSILQYLEGCLLVTKIVEHHIKTNSKGDINIVFALANDENKYYKDDASSLQRDIEFLIKHLYPNFLDKRNINIKFLCFKYGNSDIHRPYNSPGKVLKRNKLLLSHITNSIEINDKKENHILNRDSYFNANFSINSKSLLVELETERLYMRSCQPEDYEYSVSLYGNSDIIRYFDHGKSRSRKEVLKLTEEMTKYFHNGEPFGLFSIFKKGSGEFVGHADFMPTNNPGIVEIGFIINPHFQKQGFCTEAAKALIVDYVNELNIKGFTYKNSPLLGVIATVHPKNLGSRKVLEKIGMNFEKQINRFDQPRLLYSKFSKEEGTTHSKLQYAII